MRKDVSEAEFKPTWPTIAPWLNTIYCGMWDKILIKSEYKLTFYICMYV